MLKWNAVKYSIVISKLHHRIQLTPDLHIYICFIYICYSLIRYMNCKQFLPFNRLSSQFHDHIFCRTKVLILMQPSLSILSFIVCGFWCQNQATFAEIKVMKSCSYIFIFSSKYFIIFTLKPRHVIHFSAWYELRNFILHMDTKFSEHRLLKRLFFPY